MKNEIRSQLNADLSMVTWTAHDQHAVMNRIREGSHKPVKKRVSFTAILVIALMVIGATAAVAEMLGFNVFALIGAKTEEEEVEILTSYMDGEGPLEIHRAVDMEEKTAIPLSEWAKRFFNDETGEYMAFNGEAWGLPYEDSSVKDEIGEYNVMTSENGDIFVYPGQKYCIEEHEKMVFKTEYAFAKDVGLYGGNVRFVFQNTTDEFIAESLTMLISELTDTYGAVDSMGKEAPTDFEGIDIYDYKERFIYLGSNDTFLRLNLRCVQKAVILDIDTGLVSAFPKL